MRPYRPLGADAAAYWGELGGPMLAEAAAPGCEWFREGDAKFGEAAAYAASEASSCADAELCCLPDHWTWSRGSTVVSASDRAACDPAACPLAKVSSALFSSASSLSSLAEAAAGPVPVAARSAPTGCIQWVVPAARAQPAGRSTKPYGRAAIAVGLAGMLAKVAAYVESASPGSLALLCAVVLAVVLAAKVGGLDEGPEEAVGSPSVGAEHCSSMDEAASLAELLCPACLSYGPEAV